MPFELDDALALYARVRTSAVRQLQLLSPTDAEAAVPGCPGWSVTNVMAHVSGLVAETLAGVPLPRGSDEATARQVRDRAHLSLVQICEEWLANADAFATFGRDDPAYVAALTADLVVHALDIGEALGGKIEVDTEAIQLVAHRYGRALQQRAADAGCPVHLVLDGTALPVPDMSEADTLELEASSLEFLLAVTGRRRGSQVRAMRWSRDPEALLANAWSQYGPLQD